MLLRLSRVQGHARHLQESRDSACVHPPLRRECTRIVRAWSKERYPIRSHAGGTKEDIATFRIGQRWYAARVNEIVETINDASLFPPPFMPPMMVGCTTYKGSPCRARPPAAVGRLCGRFRSPGNLQPDRDHEKPDGTCFGLWSTILRDHGGVTDRLASCQPWSQTSRRSPIRSSPQRHRRGQPDRRAQCRASACQPHSFGRGATGRDAASMVHAPLREPIAKRRKIRVHLVKSMPLG